MPANVRDVYHVGIPEEDPKIKNNYMNIVPQSQSLELLEFFSSSPITGETSLMLSPSHGNTTMAYPSTGNNSIVHQTAGFISNSNTPSSVLNMPIIGAVTGNRGNASKNIALFKNTKGKLGLKAVLPKIQKGCNR